MAMRIAGWVCLALALAAASPARAVDLYLEIQGGGSFFQDSDIDVKDEGFHETGQIDFDPGWTFGAAFGARFYEMLRAEVHASWRMADLDAARLEGVTIQDDDPFVGATMVLGNAYFDIPVRKFPVKPYVGAGLGVGIFSADTGTDNFFFRRAFNQDGDDAQLAWNVMAGFFVPVVEHIELDLRYRYLAANDPKMDVDMFGLNLDGNIESEFETHELVGALRFVW